MPKVNCKKCGEDKEYVGTICISPCKCILEEQPGRMVRPGQKPALTKTYVIDKLSSGPNQMGEALFNKMVQRQVDL